MPVPGRSFGRIDHVAISSQSISTISHLEFMPYTGKVLLRDHNSLSATDDRIVRLTHQTVRSRSVIGKKWLERAVLSTCTFDGLSCALPIRRVLLPSPLSTRPVH